MVPPRGFAAAGAAVDWGGGGMSTVRTCAKRRHSQAVGNRESETAAFHRTGSNDGGTYLGGTVARVAAAGRIPFVVVGCCTTGLSSQDVWTRLLGSGTPISTTPNSTTKLHVSFCKAALGIPI